MLRGLYSAASGMITQQRRHDTVTNNIANLNTPGYKQVNAVSRSFPEMLISLVNGGEGETTRTIGRLNTGVMVEENIASFIQGDLQETNNPADLALVSSIQVTQNVNGQLEAIPFDASGKAVNQEGQVVFQPQAFFTVWNANDEERYTRNGKLFVNEGGELVTTDGFRVLGRDGQPIILDAPVERLRMDQNGLIYDAATGEQALNQDGGAISLLISQVDNPNQLIREGNGVYRLDNPEDNPARPVDNIEEITVYQGFIERSNVDAAQAMVDMTTALRAYEANQKVIQFYDRSLDKAVNEVGRV
jgi:flagellar basal-body rod protein FlgF